MQCICFAALWIVVSPCRCGNILLAFVLKLFFALLLNHPGSWMMLQEFFHLFRLFCEVWIFAEIGYDHVSIYNYMPGIFFKDSSRFHGRYLLHKFKIII